MPARFMDIGLDTGDSIMLQRRVLQHGRDACKLGGTLFADAFD